MVVIVVAAVVWVVGLVTIVPYATWYLLFEAPRDHYALLIVLIGFWVLGYWGAVAPIVLAVQARRVFRAIRTAGSGDQLKEALASPDARDVAIELIAAEHHVPRFVASRLYDIVVRRLATP